MEYFMWSCGYFVFNRHHRIRENTIASFKSAAKHVSHQEDYCMSQYSCPAIASTKLVFFLYSQGVAFVEFDVHLSKDAVPIVYHDLTCCISTKKVNYDCNWLLRANERNS